MANTHTTLASLFSDIADAIRGKTGETGTLVADNFPDLIAGIPEGVSGIDYGEVTVGSATSIVVEHNLGVNPRMVALIGNGNQNTGSASTIIIYPAYAYDGIAKSLVTQTYSGSRNAIGINMGNVGDTSIGAVVDEQSISFYASYSSNMYPFRGTYTWIAIA